MLYSNQNNYHDTVIRTGNDYPDQGQNNIRDSTYDYTFDTRRNTSRDTQRDNRREPIKTTRRDTHARHPVRNP